MRNLQQWFDFVSIVSLHLGGTLLPILLLRAMCARCGLLHEAGSRDALIHVLRSLGVRSRKSGNVSRVLTFFWSRYL